MQITVDAMTLREMLTAADALEWRRFDALNDVPRERCVYFWAGSATAIPAGQWRPLVPFDPAKLGDVADDVVLYIGSASGDSGLRGRLSGLWPRDLSGDAASHGHATVMNRHDGRLYAAIVESCPDEPCQEKCDGTDGARTWERRLTILHLLRTGIVPVVNGGAWYNRGTHYDKARAWATAATRF